MTKSCLYILAFALCSCGAPPKKVDLIIHSASIIEVATGKILANKAIAVSGDTIAFLFNESELGLYEARNVYDAKGKFIIPGLWDMHVHFGGGDTLIQENKNLLPLYVANGITTVRDCAADLGPSVLAWRDEINQGTLFGPTIFSSGPKLEGFESVWIGDIEVDSEEEMKEALDLLGRLRVDFVKVTDNTLKPDLYLKILKEAKQRGFRTSAHVPWSLTLQEVSDAGLGTVEHGGYLLKAGAKGEREIADQVASGKVDSREALSRVLKTFDQEIALEYYKKLAKNGTAVVPTLTISKTLAYLDQEDHTGDDYLQYIGAGLRKTYEGRIARASRDNAEAIRIRHQAYEATKSALPLIQKAGMKIIAGTDAGYLNSFVYPGLALHQELELFNQAGLTTVEVLQTATVNGPWFMQREKEYGGIEAGKKADLVILNKDPLADIRNTREIDAVVLKGRLLKRQALDSILTEVKRLASIR